MSKSSLDVTAVASTLIAAAVGVLLIPPGFTWLASILGLVLLIVLLAFDEEGYRSIFQTVAFAGACGFCLTLASVIFYQFAYGLPTPLEPPLVNKWLPLTWAFTTVLIALLDRARMGARNMLVQPGAATLGTVLSPRPTAAGPFAEQYPAPVYETQFGGIAPHLVRNEPGLGYPVTPPAPAPMQAPPAQTYEPMPAPAPPHAFAPAPAQAFAPTPVPPPKPIPTPPPLKLTEIYVHLTGESLNLMRSVQAEALGRDYFRIVDTMPENETWQFVPGQVVRCKKQSLSTGKAMVAYEEAPRAQ